MTTLRFLVSLITKDNDYQMEQAASAKAAATELGVEAQIVYANDDPITQSTQLLKAIQSEPSLRPNGILVEPVGATSFPKWRKLPLLPPSVGPFSAAMLNTVPSFARPRALLFFPSAPT